MLDQEIFEAYANSIKSIRSPVATWLSNKNLLFTVCCLNPDDFGFCEFEEDGSPVTGTFNSVLKWIDTNAVFGEPNLYRIVVHTSPFAQAEFLKNPHPTFIDISKVDTRIPPRVYDILPMLRGYVKAKGSETIREYVISFTQADIINHFQLRKKVKGKNLRNLRTQFSIAFKYFVQSGLIQLVDRGLYKASLADVEKPLLWKSKADRNVGIGYYLEAGASQG
jgi:hypothetical protein